MPHQCSRDAGILSWVETTFYVFLTNSPPVSGVVLVVVSGAARCESGGQRNAEEPARDH